MYQIPKCRISQSNAEKLCISKNCQLYPFICSDCPNKNCQSIHKHQNEYKTIDQKDLFQLKQLIREKCQVSTSSINPKLLKKLDNISSVIQQIKNKYEKLLGDYDKKVQKAKVPSNAFQKLENQNYELLTGRDIYQLKNSISTNSYFLNKQRIEQQYEQEAYKLNNLIESLEKQIQKYFTDENSEPMQSSKSVEDQNNVVAYWNIAVNNQNLGKYEEAQQNYLKIIRINPNFDTLHPSYKDFNVFFNLAVVYHRQEKFDKALQYYTKAIQKNPAHSRSFLNRGVLNINQNNIEAAVQDYSEYLNLVPNDAEMYHKRGILYTLLNNFQQAEQDFSQAIKLDDKKVAYYESRGKVYKQLDQIPKSIEDFNKAIKLDPNNQDLYYQISITYHNDKKFEEALKNYNQVLKINKNNHNARHYRALVQISLQHFQEAITDLKQYLNYSQTADIYNKLGQLYLRKNQFAEAFQMFKKSTEINNKDDRIYYNAAFVCKQLNRLNQAEQMIDKAIQLCPHREQYKDLKVMIKNSTNYKRRLTIKNLKN